MKNRWFGYGMFVLVFVAVLLLLAKAFPYNNSRDNLLNRILPLGGIILGQEPQAWIGDVATNQRVAGKGRGNRPISVDVDFIKVKGKWYKVRGPIYITRSGNLIGWHREITLQESNDLGKWLFLVE